MGTGHKQENYNIESMEDGIRLYNEGKYNEAIKILSYFADKMMQEHNAKWENVTIMAVAF